jgi:hypothetical protein
LEFKDADQNRVNLYDHERRKLLAVYIDSLKKKLYREYHDYRTDCLRVGFCLGIPEVYRLLTKDGFKSSKPSRNN